MALLSILLYDFGNFLGTRCCLIVKDINLRFWKEA